ncbi:MAG: hypothetical protein GF320_20420 [Armatimonadia bacterium]|nr:hypothetical protein [Armatimonadia bacterium]
MTTIRSTTERVRMALANPVFTREFRVRLRGTRGAWLMLAYVGLVGGIALLVVGLGMSGVSRPTQQQMGEWSRNTLLGIFITQCCLIVAAVPGMLGAAIGFERQGQTLEQLAITPLKATHVVLGKLGAAMTQLGYLMLATVPVASICFLMGGVSWDALLPGLVVCACGALGAAATAVFCSTLFKSPVAGIVLAYIIAFIYNLGIPFGETILRDVLRSHLSGSSDPQSLPLIPWIALFALVEEMGMGRGYWLDSELWWLTCSALNVAAAGGLTILAIARVRSILRPGALP